jgi:hypothetical protein
LSLVENRVLWFRGPYAAGESDIKVFRRPEGIMNFIPAGKKVIADKGYRGEDEKISIPNSHDSQEVKDSRNGSCKT